MSPLLDIDIEWSYFILVMLCTAAGAWLEWKREGSELRELRTKVEVLEQTTVRVDDWSEMTSRQMYLDKMVTKLVDEWEGAEDASD